MIVRILCLILLHIGVIRCDSGGDIFKSGAFMSPGRPGPWVYPTKGQAWPKPKLTKEGAGGTFMVLDPNNFQFELDENLQKCELISSSLNRFYQRTFGSPRKRKQTAPFDSNHPLFDELHSSTKFQGILEKVRLVMPGDKGCVEKYPMLDMDEKYEIKIDSPDRPMKAEIIAYSVWGMLRGLETFSQIVYFEEEKGGVYQVKSVQIMDTPRFTHRGVMLDSSRHFLSKRVLLDNLDLMEMNKFNVFHWHLTDNPAFPYTSIKFPNMSIYGSYNAKTHTYSQEDVRDIIEYARVRGIRVIPEFDTPGHTQSWELGHPGLLAKCYRGSVPDGLYGPMDPTEQRVYDFLKVFFKEIVEVFPDQYVHLGGDEVDLSCWRSNPKIRQYVTSKLHGDFRKLESDFISELISIVDKLSKHKKVFNQSSPIVWQEVYDNKDKITPETVVQVWKGNEHQYLSKLQEITSQGYRALLSTPWYLNYINYGSDWVKYYNVEPQQITGSDQQKKLIIGGEACMWGEFVNSINLLPRLWPRASAVAERLWSDATVRDYNAAARRLEEHTCRLLERGYPVEPINGPSFCPVSW